MEGFYWDNFETKIVNELIEVNGKVVLDLGCGGGRYALSLCQKAKKVIGIDISDNLIQIAKKKLSPEMPIEFLVGDATRTCFKDEYFDVVVSLGMLEYLENPTPFLVEIERVLKPSGEFVFVFHNRKSSIRSFTVIRSIAKPLLKPIKDFLFRQGTKTKTTTSYYGTPSDLRNRLYRKVHHSMKEMATFLTSNGLELVDYRTITHRSADTIFSIGSKVRNKGVQSALFRTSIGLNRLLGKSILMKRYGGNLIVRARKRMDVYSLKCPICNSKNVIELFEGKDRLLHMPGRFYVMKCRSCEILFTYPILAVDELGKFYPNEYHVFNTHRMKHGTHVQVNRYKSIKHKIGTYIKKIYSKSLYMTLLKKSASEFLKAFTIQLFCLPFRRYVHTLPPYESRPGRLLDIGCATGNFLYSMRRAGWEVFGVETNENACLYAREVMKLDVFNGGVLQAKYDSEYFDVVNMSQVLEHFPNPLDELKETYRILKKNGILIIKLPNLSKLETAIFGKYWYAWDLPRHRFHFSVKTLSNLLDKANFKIIRVDHSTNINNFIGSCRYYLEERGFPKYLSDFFNINNKILLKTLKPLGYLLKISRQSGRITVYAIKRR